MLVQIPAQCTEKDGKLRFEYGVRLDDHFLGLEWSQNVSSSWSTTSPTIPWGEFYSNMKLSASKLYKWTRL